MSEEVIFYLLIGIVVFDFVLERVLHVLNSRSSKKPIPAELAGIYDEAAYHKQQEYHRVSDRFENVTAFVSFAAMILALSLGWFGMLDKWLRVFSPFEPITPLLFFGCLFLLSDWIGTPFSWYHQFVIEERFGFNKMTQKTFWFDKVKAYLLTIILGGLLLVVLIYLVMLMGKDFWLYFWGVITIVILLLNMFYTSLFLPLFNKLTPLEDGELKTSIFNYAQKVGFPLTNVFVMDGSKRSSKGNAFFSGLGRRKKVVLFDTLIEKHTVEELTAIFAHEVGHYKKKHIIQATMISVLTIGAMLFLFSRLAFNSETSWALGGDISALHLNMLAFGILYSPLSRILGLFGNALSRKNEYEADSYAVETFGGVPLISAIRKLSSDHLSNLTPHPAYVFVHYSHPPLLERVKAMRRVE